MDSIQGFLALAIMLIAGGGVEIALDWIPAFAAWKPTDSRQKMIVVYVATCLVGGVLVWVKDYVAPTYFPVLSPGAQVLLVSLAVFSVSQFVHFNKPA